MPRDNRNKSLRQRARFVEQMALLKMLVLLSLVLLVVLLVIIIKPQNKFFYATPDKGSTLLRLTAMDHPSLTQDFVLRWAKVVVRQAYNYNFNNYDTVLDSIKDKFTSSGYSIFRSAVEASGLVPVIKSKQLIMSAIVPSDAEVLYRGKLDNRFIWVIRMPLLLNFESASEPSYQRRRWVRLTVTRVSPLVAPYSGIQISRFITL